MNEYLIGAALICAALGVVYYYNEARTYRELYHDLVHNLRMVHTKRKTMCLTQDKEKFYVNFRSVD